MKKIYLLLLLVVLLTVGCTNDSAGGGKEVAKSASGEGKGGSLATFALKGDYLYTVDYRSLSVFNVKNPKNPIKVNTVDVGFNIETLFSYNDYLFIGSRDAMYIYDVKNAELPKKMSQSNHFTSCDPVVANKTTAYVTLHAGSNCGGGVNELRVYDVKNVETPKLLNTRRLEKPKGLSLYGDNYLLVCDGDVKIFDVSNPKDSKYINSIPVKNSMDIIIIKDHAFIISKKSIDQYQLNYKDIEKFVKISTFSF